MVVGATVPEDWEAPEESGPEAELIETGRMVKTAVGVDSLGVGWDGTEKRRVLRPVSSSTLWRAMDERSPMTLDEYLNPSQTLMVFSTPRCVLCWGGVRRETYSCRRTPCVQPRPASKVTAATEYFMSTWILPFK